jgi:CHAT domain-containing protein
MKNQILFLFCCFCFQNASAQKPLDHFQVKFDSLIKVRQIHAADSLAHVWESEARKVFGVNSLERAVALGQIAWAEVFLQHIPLADSLFSAAVEVAEKAGATASLEFANLRELQGSNKFKQSKYAATLECYERAHQIRQKLLGGENILTLRAANGIANALIQLGRYQAADSILATCLAVLERTEQTETQTYALALGAYGDLMMRSSQLKKAAVCFEKVIAVRKKLYGEKHPSYLVALGPLANLYTFSGRPEAAERLLRKQLEHIELEKSGWTMLQIANVYRLLGKVEMVLGLFETSIQHLETAKKINEQAGNTEGKLAVLVLGDLASAYSAFNLYPKADSSYRNALAISEKIFGPNASETLRVLTAWTEHLLNSRQNVQAAESLANLETRYRAASDTTAFTSTAYFGCKALFAEKTGQNTAALGFCDQAVALARTVGEDKNALKELLFLRTKLLISSGQAVNAVANYREFQQMEIDNLLAALQLLSDHERQQIWQRQAEVHALLGNLALKNPEIPLAAELADQQLFAKNILESTTRKTQQFVQNARDSSLLKKYEDWLNARAELNFAYQQPPETAQKQNIDFKKLENEANELEKSLIRLGVPLIPKDKTPSWTNLRDGLRDGEAAVDVMRFALFNSGDFRDTAIYAFSIIKPGATEPSLVFLENGNDLESFAIGQYQNEISRKKDLSPNLYEKMWAPVAAHLHGVKTIYFSPDGIFHKINLNTLRAADGTYLLENIEIKAVTNLRNILEQGKESAGAVPGFAALFGNPAFKTGALSSASGTSADLVARTPLYRDITEDAKGDLYLPPLPGSEREVKAIAKKLTSKNWQPTVFTGAQATEDTLKRLKSPKVLHIATHGYFLNSEKTSSSTEPISPQAGKNPALRSMLFFSGAENSIAGENTGRNDGILTAFEAAVLNLDKTELVVLSACNTGLGKIQNGEGVFGLQRAFRIAGAKSLIMSLWEVEDAATELLMNAFYENWLAGMSKSAAFRKAQLALKAKYPQPFYWGSFILVNG